MMERKSLLSNIFFSALSWMSSFVFLALLILAARFLGDEIYGQFAFAYSLVALFEIATDLGLRDYLVREVARAREKTSVYLGIALVQKTILTVVTVALLFLAAALLDLKYEVRVAICVLTLAMVCKSYKLLFRAILIAHERFNREALIVYVERAVLLFACTIALVVGEGLLPFVITFLAASAVGLIVTYFGAGRSLRKVSRPTEWLDWAKTFRKALPFGLTAAAMMIYFRLDSVMLSLMRNDAEVGWYNAAYRLTEGLIVIPSFLYYALFPRFSILHHESRADLEELTRRACKYMIAVAIGIAAVGIVETDRLVVLAYGEEYFPAADALKILLMGIIFMFLWSMFVTLLNATNRPQVPFIGISLGSMLNVGFNFFLIPRYGFLGASASTVLAEIFVFCFLFFVLRREGYELRLIRSLIRPALAALPCIGIMLLLSRWNLFLVALAGGTVYAVSLIALRFLEPGELEVLARAGERLQRWTGFAENVPRDE